jgi:hypothetical protein
MKSIAIFLLITGLYSVIIAYQAIRYRKLFWFYPSISGFKTRKKDKSPKIFSRMMGIYVLVIALIMFFFAYKLLQ